MEEKWKTIEGYPNYQVSNKGEVKSLNYKRTKKEKILKPIKTRDGYFQIVLKNEGIYKHMYIHRLVASAFLSNPLNLPQINHINEIKEDNRVENLEYCDAKYNSNYGTRNERMAKAVSKSNTNNPKRSKKIICIETGKIYPSTMEVKRKLGFSQGNVSSCCIGKRNTCGGYHWRYVD